MITMGGSSLPFMTCEELREEFSKCITDINKRILIIDVRNAALFERSHLCLDLRNIPIQRKMRVMNIDPDLIKICTSKQIMSLLNADDLKVFTRRKDATEVVIIDSNTDDISKLMDPKYKVMKLINGLTKYDNIVDAKIVVPIQILEGGYRKWLLKYPHFTTDPTFDPDAEVKDFKSNDPPTQNNHIQPIIANTTPISPPIQPSIMTPATPPPRPSPSSPMVHTQIAKPAISKPVPIPPTKVVTPKPNVVKNAPGTAVPVTPNLYLRPALPRSHSSPNVAQTDGDEFDEPSNQFDKLILTNNVTNQPEVNINNNHINPSLVPSSNKPRFDRTLKPSLNSESVNAIRARLNFGRSPEASGKAISGLQNLGNTCFMNSVIQCLAYAPALVSYFCSDLYYSHINFSSSYGSKGELAIEFGSLVEKLNAHRHRYIEPKSFREAIVKHIGFAGNEQQDSHEFMMMLFDKLHHDLSTHAKDKFKQNGIGDSNNEDGNINIPRATLGHRFWERHLNTDKSIISDLFEGIFMSTLTCAYCKGQSNTFEVFNCLSLPIPSDTRCHIRECLSHFSNPERIEAAWECPRCKQKREADKKIVICKLPKILIIHLKRFSQDGRWRQKLQTTVDFPLTDLSIDCTYVLPNSAYGPTPYRSSYNLNAVVNHFGHLDGGHYTAFCKLENQRWYTFDDSNVSEMRDADVSGQSAYILFYSAS